MVVHGLKNPVTGIAMLVQLLPHRGALSDLQQRNLFRIDRMCREMLRLIANVLEIAKIARSRALLRHDPRGGFGAGHPRRARPNLREVHDARQFDGGTALGLPFCKLAVERMGGRIALKSPIGVGTEFAVSLRVSG